MSQQLIGTRRGALGVIVLSMLLLVSSLTPAGLGVTRAFGQDFWESEYERNQDDLAKARSSLGLIGDDISAATADLRVIDNQLAGMYSELAASEAELDEAALELEKAAARTASADAEVASATARWHEAQALRELSEEVFEGRVVALWKYGTHGYAEAILNADSISDAITQSHYVNRVFENDRAMIGDIAVAEAQIGTERSNLDAARDTLRLEESVVQASVTAVERLTTIQQTLVEQVEVEQGRRKRILDALRADEKRYKLTVSALEAESNRIREELLKSRYAAGRPGKGEFVWPTSGAPGSGYGYRTHPISGQRKLHTGVDIGAPTGQKIVAVTDGLVVSAEWRGGYGLAVVIDHGGGVATLYAHQSRLAVSEGAIVASGQTIGYVGSTGYSTGPHLHFEVRVDGTPVDPMDWY